MTERLFEPTDTDDRRAWQRSVRGPFPDPSINTVGASHECAEDTERAAAALVMPRTGGDRIRVLTLLAESPGPLTDDEIADALGLRRYTAAPRRGDLKRAGWVEAHPTERHPTDSGALATCWQLTVRGREAWARWNRRGKGTHDERFR